MTENNILNPAALFDRQVHYIGRITILTCIIMALCVPLLALMIFDLFPPVKFLVSGIITVSSFMIPLSIAEIVAFYPILGSGGLYISYTTGNIANLKLPCAAIAMEAAEVDPSTKEGEVISILAMAGSVIVSEIILILGVLLLVPVSNYLQNPVIKPAFEQILPALFGSLGAYFILKNFKLSLIPLVFGGVVAVFALPIALAVPVGVFLSIFGAKMMYKKGWVRVE